MFIVALLLLCTVVTFHSSSFVRSEDYIVDTGYVKYLGNNTRPNAVAYLGIPYAEPPLGPRRFRAPLPLNTSRVMEQAGGKVVDARAYSDFCIQGALGPGDHGGAGSEDCLKVDIYAPTNATRNSKLPVLVYIHGGGYVFGNPANWPFDHWIQQSPNVVVVSVYYRLSGFGFLAHPSFSSTAGPSNQSSIGDLNAGFLDQLEALRWVQLNIRAFGGDPTKVTINGESAGGSSIELHLVAAGTGLEKGKLFRGAIAQSVYRTPVPLPEQQVPLFDAFAAHVGCGTGSVEEKVVCLRSASVSALAIAQDNVTATLRGYHAFHPVVDRKLIPDFPTRAIQNGIFARVPLIVGATSNETLSGGPDIDTSLKSFFPSLADASVATLDNAYPESAFADATVRFRTITGDAELRCTRTIMAAAWANKGIKAWAYRYNQRNPTGSSTAVEHAAENWMMFRGTNTGINGTTTFTTMNPTEEAFAAELIAYWLSFVCALNPNTFKFLRSPTWDSYTMSFGSDITRRKRMVLQEPVGGSIDVSGSIEETEGKDEVRRCGIVNSLVGQMEN